MDDETLDQRDPKKDLMPEGMDEDKQQDTKSAASKIAAALEFAVTANPDTPDRPGQGGK